MTSTRRSVLWKILLAKAVGQSYPDGRPTAVLRVVLDRTNCPGCKRSIGMPSVVPVGRRLALFYDTGSGNMGCDVSLAWLNLPLEAPQ